MQNKAALLRAMQPMAGAARSPRVANLGAAGSNPTPLFSESVRIAVLDLEPATMHFDDALGDRQAHAKSHPGLVG